MKGLAERSASVERPASTLCGSPILALSIATWVAAPFILMEGIRMHEWPTIAGGFAVILAMAIVWCGFFTLEPSEACVLVAFGEYVGTVRDTGFHWANPFARKMKVNLRARTLSVDRLKIHDKDGAPIEMAAVIVWRVVETARANFDVQDVTDYVRDQCGSAVRHLASSVADQIDQTSTEARRGQIELPEHLRSELQERVLRAGVTIDETRLTHRCEHWSPVHANTAVEV